MAENPERTSTEPETEDGLDESSLRQALEAEQDKAGEYLANWQRAQADFINYKRRAEQERTELARYANAGLLKNLLPAANDLSRALEHTPPKLAKTPWVEGLRMVAAKLEGSLTAAGLTRIPALGEPFDPNFHEAVRQQPGAEGMVVEEVSPGYMLNDRLLTPAIVVVGSGEAYDKEDT